MPESVGDVDIMIYAGVWKGNANVNTPCSLFIYAGNWGDEAENFPLYVSYLSFTHIIFYSLLLSKMRTLSVFLVFTFLSSLPTAALATQSHQDAKPSTSLYAKEYEKLNKLFGYAVKNQLATLQALDLNGEIYSERNADCNSENISIRKE